MLTPFIIVALLTEHKVKNPRAQELDPTIIAQESTKDVKKEVKDVGKKTEETQDFQNILEDLKEAYDAMRKKWFLAGIYYGSANYCCACINYIPYILNVRRKKTC